jgi:glycosyltransferase involved in cell wall biosynthesis
MIVIDTAFLGGPGKGLLQLLRHLRGDRYSFIVCAFSYRHPKSTEFIDAIQASGYELRLLTQRFRFDPAAIVEAVRIARKEKVTMVQSHGYKAHVVASIVTARLLIPWFAMTHGWTCENWKVRFYNQIERLLLKRADIAGAVSSPLHREIVRLRGPDRPSHLILNAVDANEIKGEKGGDAVRSRHDIPANHTLLGVFGRLSPEKAPLIALEAFHHLCQEFENVSLLFVGDGPLRAAIRERATELDLEKRVILADHQSRMRDFYEAIDLLVIPSLSEGLPNVLLEAMALGVPSLCTRAGGIPDVIEHDVTGWLVSPGDVNGLTNQLRKVVAAPGRRQQVASAARDSLYPRFSASTRADLFLSIYDELHYIKRISATKAVT